MSGGIREAILRSAIGLALFAMVTAGLIALTQTGTKERIQQAIDRSQSKALFAVLPQSLQADNLLGSAFDLPADTSSLGLGESARGYRVMQEGKVAAIILPWLSREGYTGPIQGIVGLTPDGQILGVRITQHKETPGLGDKIERRKSDWVDGFVGRSLNNPEQNQWKVRKDGGDFDQMTGATVTPRAVVKAVLGALQYFRQNATVLLAPPTLEPLEATTNE